VSNPAIAQLIATNLATGLPHPGENGSKPFSIPLPAFRTVGMPKDMAENAQKTASLLGESIVHLIECNGCEIVDKTELEQLRAPADPQRTPVNCSQCGNPLFWLPVVNGRASINPNILTAAKPECPHI
jgi:hypothetical protein